MFKTLPRTSNVKSIIRFRIILSLTNNIDSPTFTNVDSDILALYKEISNSTINYKTTNLKNFFTAKLETKITSNSFYKFSLLFMRHYSLTATIFIFVFIQTFVASLSNLCTEKSSSGVTLPSSFLLKKSSNIGT